MKFLSSIPAITPTIPQFDLLPFTKKNCFNIHFFINHFFVIISWHCIYPKPCNFDSYVLLLLCEAIELQKILRQDNIWSFLPS